MSQEHRRRRPHSAAFPEESFESPQRKRPHVKLSPIVQTFKAMRHHDERAFREELFPYLHSDQCTFGNLAQFLLICDPSLCVEHARKYSAVLQLYLENFDSRDEKNARYLSTILHQLVSALISLRVQGRLDQYCIDAIPQMFILLAQERRANAQDKANGLWALAKLSEIHPDLLKEVGPQAIVKLFHALATDAGDGRADPQEKANGLWVLAKLSEMNPDLLEKVHPQAIKDLFYALATDAREGKANAQNKANGLWALAKLNEMIPNLLTEDDSPEIRDLFHALARDGRANAQEKANGLWVLAKLNEMIPNLLTKNDSPEIRDLFHALARDGRANAQDKANGLWALAKLSEMNPALLKKVHPQAIKDVFHALATDARAGKANAQNKANGLWALAKLNEMIPNLLTKNDFPEIRDLFYELARDGRANAQDKANGLWALAKLSEMNPDLLKKVHPQVIRDLVDALATDAREGRANAQEEANGLWALAKLNEMIPNLLTKNDSQEIRDLFYELARDGRANAQNKANGLWALAKLSEAMPSLLDKVGSKKIEALFVELVQDQQSNLTYKIDALLSLARITFYCNYNIIDIQTQIFKALRDLSTDTRLNHISEGDCKALLQAEQFFLHHFHLKDALNLLVVNTNSFSKSRSSGSHKKVASLFKQEKIQQEYQTKAGYSLDIWLPDSHIAVEVCGPTHYLPDGKTLKRSEAFRQHLLVNCCGVQEVVYFNYQDINQFEKDGDIESLIKKSTSNESTVQALLGALKAPERAERQKSSPSTSGFLAQLKVASSSNPLQSETNNPAILASVRLNAFQFK